MAYGKKQQDRIDKGLCRNCDTPRSGTAKVYCPGCIEKAKNHIDVRRSKLRDSGLCIDCGKETKDDRVHCETCLTTKREHRTNWKAQVPRGFCTRCKKNKCLPQLIDAKLYMRSCQECYLRHAASAQLGSSKHYHALLSKLERQQWKCAYSGDEIILGVNDSIDHIYPKSRYPDRSLDITNIQWVTRVINRMKDNLTPEEFLDMASRIYSLSLSSSSGTSTSTKSLS